MANTKIKDMTNKATVVATDQIPINDVAGGDADKMATAAGIKAFCNTLVDIGAIFWPPQLNNGGPSSASFGTNAVTINASNDQYAFVGIAPRTTNIKKIHFRTGTVTAGGTTTTVGVYQVGTDGRPALTPTLWSANGTGANPSGTLTVAGSNTWQTVTLTNQAELVAGDVFAVVISTTGSPNYQVLEAAGHAAGFEGQTPLHLLSDAGGAYANTGNSSPWVAMFESSTANDILHYPGITPQDGSGTLTGYSTGSTPDEWGMKFVAPFRGRITGLRVMCANFAAASTLLASLWDSTADAGASPTPLAQGPSFDGDTTISTTQDGYINFYFTTPYEVTPGTTYYAGIRATSANAIAIGALPVTAGITNAIRGFPIGSNTIHLAKRTWTGADPGAWADTTTTLPVISLIFDKIIA